MTALKTCLFSKREVFKKYHIVLKSNMLQSDHIDIFSDVFGKICMCSLLQAVLDAFGRFSQVADFSISDGSISRHVRKFSHVFDLGFVRRALAIRTLKSIQNIYLFLDFL